MSQDHLGHEPPKRTLSAVVVAGAAVILGIAFDLLFFKHAPGLSVPIFWALVIGAVVLFDRFTHHHLNWREMWYAFLILVLASFFAIRASEFLMALNSIAIFYLFLLMLANLYGVRVGTYHLPDFFTFPLIDVLSAVFGSFGVLKDLRPRHVGSRRVVIGIIGALAFVILFVALFASADRVVAKLLQSVFTDALGQMIQHLVVVFFASLGILLAFAPAFWKRMTARVIGAATAPYDFGFEAIIVFVASNLVFAGFIAIQALYLFGGKETWKLLDIPYSQYAHEGFAQLLIVSLIVAAMIWTMRRIKASRFNLANQLLQVALILQTFGVLVSAWMRLSLYEDAYGFTQLRLFSHYFLIVVAITLALFAISIFVKWQNGTVLHGVVSIMVVALIGLNVMNPDLFIATKNLAHATTSTVPLDIQQLLMLSDDAAKPIAEYLNGQYPVLRQKNQARLDALAELQAIEQQSLKLGIQAKSLQSAINASMNGAPELKPQLEDVQKRLNELTRRQAEASRIAYPKPTEVSPAGVHWDAIATWVNKRTPTDWQSWNLARRDGAVYRDAFRKAGMYAINPNDKQELETIVEGQQSVLVQ